MWLLIPCIHVPTMLCLGVELFSSGIGDLYYPSNEMDPYINDAKVSFNTWSLYEHGTSYNRTLLLCFRMMIPMNSKTWLLIQLILSLFMLVLKMMWVILRWVQCFLASEVESWYITLTLLCSVYCSKSIFTTLCFLCCRFGYSRMQIPMKGTSILTIVSLFQRFHSAQLGSIALLKEEKEV